MFIKPEKRGYDSMGSGEYGARRGGSRTHKGIDLCARPDQAVFSHVSGSVTKIGRPYVPNNNSEKDVLKTGLRYVQITDSADLDHRFFYLNSSVHVGQYISIGDEIGSTSDLNQIWPDMKNHVHYEVKINGVHVDPADYL